jgi:hypothetical protein
MPDAQYDAGDPNAIAEAAREVKRREAEERETIGVWMNHPNGRDLLWRIVFEVCHHARTYLAADQLGHSDTHRTFLDLGERNIGCWLDDRMRRHAGLYRLMLDEQEMYRDTRNAKLAKQAEQQGETDAS